MRIFDPHIHMSSRTTDDYERMAAAGVRVVLEPAFWLGQPRTSAESFCDYFDSLVRWCRTPDAYAALTDVRTKQQKDEMESFFFAETLKYLYLIFAPDSALDFDHIVFNTEAHPLRPVR